MQESINVNDAAEVESVDGIREALEFGFAAIVAGNVSREALSVEQLEMYGLAEEEMTASNEGPTSRQIEWQPSERLIEMYRNLR